MSLVWDFCGIRETRPATPPWPSDWISWAPLLVLPVQGLLPVPHPEPSFHQPCQSPSCPPPGSPAGPHPGPLLCPDGTGRSASGVWCPASPSAPHPLPGGQPQVPDRPSYSSGLGPLSGPLAPTRRRAQLQTQSGRPGPLGQEPPLLAPSTPSGEAEARAGDPGMASPSREQNDLGASPGLPRAGWGAP